MLVAHLMMFKSSDMMVALLSITVIYYMYHGSGGDQAFFNSSPTSEPLSSQVIPSALDSALTNAGSQSGQQFTSSYVCFILQTAMLVLALAFYTAVEVCKSSWIAQCVLPPLFVALQFLVFPLADARGPNKVNLDLPINLVDTAMIYIFTGFPTGVIASFAALAFLSRMAFAPSWEGNHGMQILSQIVLGIVWNAAGMMIYVRSYMLAMDLLYTEVYAFQAVRNLPYIHELELQSVTALECQYRRTISELNKQLQDRRQKQRDEEPMTNHRACCEQPKRFPSRDLSQAPMRSPDSAPINAQQTAPLRKSRYEETRYNQSSPRRIKCATQRLSENEESSSVQSNRSQTMHHTSLLVPTKSRRHVYATANPILSGANVQSARGLSTLKSKRETGLSKVTTFPQCPSCSPRLPSHSKEESDTFPIARPQNAQNLCKNVHSPQVSACAKLKSMTKVLKSGDRHSSKPHSNRNIIMEPQPGYIRKQSNCFDLALEGDSDSRTGDSPNFDMCNKAYFLSSAENQQGLRNFSTSSLDTVDLESDIFKPPVNGLQDVAAEEAEFFVSRNVSMMLTQRRNCTGVSPDVQTVDRVETERSSGAVQSIPTATAFLQRADYGHSFSINPLQATTKSCHSICFPEKELPSDTHFSTSFDYNASSSRPQVEKQRAFQIPRLSLDLTSLATHPHMSHRSGSARPETRNNLGKNVRRIARRKVRFISNLESASQAASSDSSCSDVTSHSLFAGSQSIKSSTLSSSALNSEPLARSGLHVASWTRTKDVGRDDGLPITARVDCKSSLHKILPPTRSLTSKSFLNTSINKDEAAKPHKEGLTDNAMHSNPSAVYVQVMNHFARMLMNQVRADMRSYRKVGTLGTTQANSEWRLMLWTFRHFLEREGMAMTKGQVWYGMRGWLPFQQNPDVPASSPFISSQKSKLRGFDGLESTDNNHERTNASTDYNNRPHMGLEGSTLISGFSPVKAQVSNDSISFSPESLTKNGASFKGDEVTKGNLQRLSLRSNGIASLSRPKLVGIKNEGICRDASMNQNVFLKRKSRRNLSCESKRSESTSTSSPKRRQNRLNSAPPMSKVGPRLVTIKGRKDSDDPSSTRRRLIRAVSIGCPVSSSRTTLLPTLDLTVSPEIRGFSYSKASFRSSYDAKYPATSHETSPIYPVRPTKLKTQRVNNHRSSTPCGPRSDPTSRLTSKESTGSAATCNSSQSELTDGTQDVLFKVRRKEPKQICKLILFNKDGCKEYYVNFEEKSKWSGISFIARWKPFFGLLERTSACILGLLEVPAFDASSENSFVNPHYERWFLDWARGSATVSQHVLFAIQLIGTFLNFAQMSVSAYWISLSMHTSVLIAPSVTHYIYLVPIFLILESLLILPQLLIGGAERIHLVNQLSILVVLERTGISIAAMVSNAKYSSCDLLIYGQLILNTLYAPLGLSLCSTLSRLLFLLIVVSSNVAFLCSQWGRIAELRDVWVRMNIAFTHLGLFIYLLYLRSQDDGRRQIFCMCGLPYLIQLSDIAKQQDSGYEFQVSLSLSLAPSETESQTENLESSFKRADSTKSEEGKQRSSNCSFQRSFSSQRSYSGYPTGNMVPEKRSTEADLSKVKRKPYFLDLNDSPRNYATKRSSDLGPFGETEILYTPQQDEKYRLEKDVPKLQSLNKYSEEPKSDFFEPFSTIAKRVDNVVDQISKERKRQRATDAEDRHQYDCTTRSSAFESLWESAEYMVDSMEWAADDKNESKLSLHMFSEDPSHASCPSNTNFSNERSCAIKVWSSSGKQPTKSQSIFGDQHMGTLSVKSRSYHSQLKGCDVRRSVSAHSQQPQNDAPCLLSALQPLQPVFLTGREGAGRPTAATEIKVNGCTAPLGRRSQIIEKLLYGARVQRKSPRRIECRLSSNNLNSQAQFLLDDLESPNYMPYAGIDSDHPVGQDRTSENFESLFRHLYAHGETSDSFRSSHLSSGSSLVDDTLFGVRPSPSETMPFARTWSIPTAKTKYFSAKAQRQTNPLDGIVLSAAQAATTSSERRRRRTRVWVTPSSRRKGGPNGSDKDLKQIKSSHITHDISLTRKNKLSYLLIQSAKISIV